MNEVQKSEIIARMRRGQLFSMVVVAIGMAAFMAAAAYAVIQNLNPFLVIGIGGAVLLVALVVMPNLYIMKLLAPITDTLPKSNQRITQIEMLRKIGVAMPKWLLVIATIGGVVMIAGTGFSMIELALNGRLASRWMIEALTMLNGLILTGFFAMLLHFNVKKQAS